MLYRLQWFVTAATGFEEVQGTMGDNVVCYDDKARLDLVNKQRLVNMFAFARCILVSHKYGAS